MPTSQHVPAQRDRTICVATSLEDAKEQGIQQKLIIIHVNSLPDTGRVNLTLAAWKVPSTRSAAPDTRRGPLVVERPSS
jgi:hypothetical protein